MPYQRRGRRNYRRRPTRRARGGLFTARNVARGAGMAVAAYRGVQYLKGLVNSELYKLDFDLGSLFSAITTTGQVIHLSAIPIGDGESERTGNSIYLRSINCHAMVYVNSAGSTGQTVRLSLICDKQQRSDTTPSYGDIYSAQTPFSHLNIGHVGKYSVMWSRTFTLSQETLESKNVSFNKALRLHIRFNGAAASDIQKNGIYMTAVSTSATNAPTIQGSVRMSYHDN